MCQKIKMAGLHLFCLIALSGCGLFGTKTDPIIVNAKPKETAGVLVCPYVPPPPAGPLACTFDGKPALCQSEVTVWLETQLVPALKQCRSVNAARDELAAQ